MYADNVADWSWRPYGLNDRLSSVRIPAGGPATGVTELGVLTCERARFVFTGAAPGPAGPVQVRIEYLQQAQAVTYEFNGTTFGFTIDPMREQVKITMNDPGGAITNGSLLIFDGVQLRRAVCPA